MGGGERWGLGRNKSVKTKSEVRDDGWRTGGVGSCAGGECLVCLGWVILLGKGWGWFGFSCFWFCGVLFFVFLCFFFDFFDFFFCLVLSWGCFGVFWGVLGCFGVFWGVLGCFGVFWGVLGCFGGWDMMFLTERIYKSLKIEKKKLTLFSSLLFSSLPFSPFPLYF